MFFADRSLDEVSWLAGTGEEADLVISTRVRPAPAWDVMASLVEGAEDR